MNMPSKQLMFKMLRKDRPQQTIKRIINVKLHEYNSHSDVPIFSVLSVIEYKVHGKLVENEIKLPYPVKEYKRIKLELE